jgi:DNA-binding PadR family transcriptional regulator
MVRLGFSSGYAIRKAAEQSTQSFWPISLAQIYPELNRLQKAGLLRRRSDPRGTQARSAYTISAAGASALSAWLSSEAIGRLWFRDEGFLRLFFADSLLPSEQLQLLGRVREKDLEMSARLRAVASFRAPPATIRFPAVLARYGAGCYDFSARRLGELEAEIEAAPRQPARFCARPAARSRSAPIKLTPTSHLILGMVDAGAASGYAIRKAAEGSTQAFWPTSFAELYPQLGRLHSAGLLERRSDPAGRRERSAYSITAEGEEALRAWLRYPHFAPTGLRYEILLRLFFADALSPSEQLALLGRFRRASVAISRWLREQGLEPEGLAEGRRGARYPAIIAEFAIERFTHSARWLRRLERQLEAGKPPRAVGDARPGRDRAQPAAASTRPLAASAPR